MSEASLAQTNEDALRELPFYPSQDDVSAGQSGRSSQQDHVSASSSSNAENKIVERLETGQYIIRERRSGEPIQRSVY